jgi:hypothetical protein
MSGSVHAERDRAALDDRDLAVLDAANRLKEARRSSAVLRLRLSKIHDGVLDRGSFVVSFVLVAVLRAHGGSN